MKYSTVMPHIKSLFRYKLCYILLDPFNLVSPLNLRAAKTVLRLLDRAMCDIEYR